MLKVLCIFLSCTAESLNFLYVKSCQDINGLPFSNNGLLVVSSMERVTTTWGLPTQKYFVFNTRTGLWESKLIGNHFTWLTDWLCKSCLVCLFMVDAFVIFNKYSIGMCVHCVKKTTWARTLSFPYSSNTGSLRCWRSIFDSCWSHVYTQTDRYVDQLRQSAAHSLYQPKTQH